MLYKTLKQKKIIAIYVFCGILFLYYRHSVSKSDIKNRLPEHTIRQKFNFLIQPNDESYNNLCLYHCFIKYDSHVQNIIIFVKSSYGNIYNRDLIRRTWASLSNVGELRLRTIFVIGRNPNENYFNRNLVEAENKEYGDILQLDYAEDEMYRKLSLKTIAAMQWASEKLSPDDMFVSTDDNFVFNITEALYNIRNISTLSRENNWAEFPIICNIARKADKKPVQQYGYKPPRSGRYKQFFKWHVFPTHCQDDIFTTSVSVASQLYEMSRYYDISHLDGALITGILRLTIGLPESNVLQFSNTTKLFYSGSKDNTFSKELSSNREFLKTWENIFQAIPPMHYYCTCKYKHLLNGVHKKVGKNNLEFRAGS